MQTLTIETTITESKNVKALVNLPSFWKENTTSYDCYRGVVDENTFIEFDRYWNGDIVTIENSTVERRKEKVIEAQTSQRWVPVTEEEFFKHYDDAFECMRLHPKLAV